MRQKFAMACVAIILIVGAFPVLAGIQTGSGGKQTSQVQAAGSTALIDINSASKEELEKLPGIGKSYSEKIIKGRPYARKDQLVSKSVLPQATYDKIKDQVIAKQNPATAK
jgi:competence protein ComEA